MVVAPLPYFAPFLWCKYLLILPLPLMWQTPCLLCRLYWHKVPPTLLVTALLMFASTIGALGAFIAGSNTVSNMMFAYFQWSTATQIGLDTAMASKVVALQAVGGATGNMVSVHNVVSAAAVVGLINREGAIIRMTLITMSYYVIQAGLLGMAFVLNPMWFIAALILPFVFFGGMSMLDKK